MIAEFSNLYANNEAFNSSSENRKILGPNDFELGLRDYSIILDNSSRINCYKPYLKELNWFQLSSLETYMDDINSFANYTKYSILLSIFKDKNYILNDIENYFSDQLYSYMKIKKIVEKDSIKILAKYLKTFKEDFEFFIEELKKFKHFQGSFDIYFNSKNNPKDLYTFTLPIIAYNNPKLIDIYLLNPYSKVNPNWFSLAAIFKIYRYFAYQDIIINNIHYSWYDLNNYFAKPIRQTIPLTENVAKLTAIYGDIFPFPHPNIFNVESKYRSNTIPLRTLVNNF